MLGIQQGRFRIMGNSRPSGDGKLAAGLKMTMIERFRFAGIACAAMTG
jgi:hypothetical protein